MAFIISIHTNGYFSALSEKHTQTYFNLFCLCFFVGPLQRVRPRNGILALVVVVVLVVLPLRSEFIGEL